MCEQKKEVTSRQEYEILYQEQICTSYGTQASKELYDSFKAAKSGKVGQSIGSTLVTVPKSCPI